MSEQPSPEPEKAKADAVPKAASAPQGLGSSPAEAYIPRPGQPPAKGRGVLALAALIAAGALAGTGYYFRAPPQPPAGIVAAASESKVLTVTDADLNAAATERERKSDAAPAALAAAGVAGAVGTVSAGPIGAPAPVAAAPSVPAENRPSSPLPVAPPELIAPAAAAPQALLTPQGQAAVRNDGFSMFSMRLIDDVDQDGDVVQILVDGVPVSYLSLTHGGATLEIPLKKGESHRVTVLAVRDGVGGVTLGLQTSAGNVVSRRMRVGESDSWTIDYK